MYSVVYFSVFGTANVSVCSPQQLYFFVINACTGSKYPRRIQLSFENKITGTRGCRWSSVRSVVCLQIARPVSGPTGAAPPTILKLRQILNQSVMLSCAFCPCCIFRILGSYVYETTYIWRTPKRVQHHCIASNYLTCKTEQMAGCEFLSQIGKTLDTKIHNISV